MPIRPLSGVQGRLLVATLAVSLIPFATPHVRAQTGFPAGSIAVRPTRSFADLFVQEVLLQFDTWDTDHDGILSEKEIDVQMLNPHNTGSAAAAISAIKAEQRRKEFIHPPWTKQYFTLYAASKRPQRPQRPHGRRAPQSDSLDTSDTGEKIAFANFNDRYEEGLRHIQENPTSLLFNPEKPLRVGTSIHQSQMGDCFLLVVLEGCINRDPDEMGQRMKANSDGSCDVIMRKGATVHLPPITDAQLALSSGSMGTGRWLAAMEEAYGRFVLRKEGATTDADDVIGADKTDLGASIEFAVDRLMGKQVSTLVFRKRGQGRPAPEDVAPLLPDLRQKVARAMLDHRLVVGGVAMTPPRPPAIEGDHVYTITGFDAATDRITLWNPYSNDFTPEGTAGLDNGYLTKRGVFTMPLQDFAQVFQQIYWEK